MRFLQNRVPWPYPPDGALTFIREIALPAMERGEAWHWTLRLKTEPDRIVGMMSEACECANNFWFDVLHFPVLRVSKAAANLASRRISEKQGMRKVAETESDYVSGRLESEIWEITAEE